MTGSHGYHGFRLPYRTALAALVLTGVLATGACSPNGVLTFLAGCKNTTVTTGDTATDSSAGASIASGEWTGLVGQGMGQIKALWPGYVAWCGTYRPGFQCTWWACMRQWALGHNVGQYWGNGAQWGESARRAGWSEGASVGGIMVFAPGSAGSSRVYGHVAVIEQIDGDTVHISEGGTGWGRVHTRTFSVSNPPLGATYWHPSNTNDPGASTPASDTDTALDASDESSYATTAAWTCETGTGTISASYTGNGMRATPDEAKAIARGMLASGWKQWDTAEQWEALEWLWEHESGWRWDADNPTSDAYGIPQALPGRKMASAGEDWKHNAATQIRWGLGYIQSRYGSPTAAKAFWLSHHWY